MGIPQTNVECNRMDRIENLRPGVQIVQGLSIQGSPYYLRDSITKQEIAISRRFYRWLTDSSREGDLIDETTEKTFQGLLDRHHLSRDSIPTDPPKRFNLASTYIYQIPLFRPDRFLDHFIGFARWLFSNTALIALGLLWCSALYLVMGQRQVFFEFERISAYAANPVWIVFALIIVKAFHECGHALAIKRAGGQVTSMGLVFIAFMPLPKTDGACLCQASWSDRFLIAAGGVYMELWIAAISAILWCLVPDSPIRSVFHFLALTNLLITLSANLLPFLKFDGYYLLSAVLKNAFLYEDSLDKARSLIHWCFGYAPQANYRFRIPSIAIGAAYGLGILVWRMLLGASIALGLVLLLDNAPYAYAIALLPVWVSIIRPAYKGIQTMRTQDSRPGAIRIRLIWIAIEFVFMAWLVVPMGHRHQAEGAIVLDKVSVRSLVDGNVTYVRPDDQAVSQGDALLSVQTDYFELRAAELRAAHVDLLENTIRRSKSDVTSSHNQTAFVDSAQINQVLGAISANEDTESLTSLKAEYGGFWRSKNEIYDYLPKGTEVGAIFRNTAPTIYFYSAHDLGPLANFSVVIEDLVHTFQAEAVNERVLGASLPDFMNVSQGGPFNIQPLEPLPYYVYSTTITNAELPGLNYEARVTGFYSVTYSIAGNLFQTILHYL